MHNNGIDFTKVPPQGLNIDCHVGLATRKHFMEHACTRGSRDHHACGREFLSMILMTVSLVS